MHDRVKFWKVGCLVLPLVGLVAPVVVARLLGGFGAELQFIDKELLPSEAFGTLGAMLFPLAGYQIARMKMEQAEALRSRSWPTVSGKVLAGNVDEKTGYRGRTFYVVTVRYAYRIGGIDYRGDRLGYAPQRLADKNLAYELGRKYAAGTTVNVYYDPEVPQESVLETTAALSKQRSWMIWLFGGLPFVAVVVVFVRAVVP